MRSKTPFCSKEHFYIEDRLGKKTSTERKPFIFLSWISLLKKTSLIFMYVSFVARHLDLTYLLQWRSTRPQIERLAVCPSWVPLGMFDESSRLWKELSCSGADDVDSEERLLFSFRSFLFFITVCIVSMVLRGEDLYDVLFCLLLLLTFLFWLLFVFLLVDDLLPLLLRQVIFL